MKFEYREGKAYAILKEIKEAIKDSYWENKVFLVGGAVRDHLLHAEIKDIDLCVNVLDGGINFAKWICEQFGCYKAFTNPCTFPVYGTAKFNLRTIHDLADMDIECVQTRKEVYKGDSRKPETVFGTIQEDAKRRDLTINALYVNLSNDEIVDPCGMGIQDLKSGVIRTPSDPNIVFKEDPLRMLRVIRFATRFGWGIEKHTWFGIISNIKRLDIVSQERISDELTKILLCDKPSVGIRRLKYCGLLEKILPEVHALCGVEQGNEHVGDVFTHTMIALDSTQKISNHRWAALLHDIGKPQTKSYKNGKIHFYNHETLSQTLTEAMLKRMKFSNEDIKQISNAVKQHMRFKSSKNMCPSNKALRKFMSENDLKDLAFVLDVINADNKAHAQGYCYPKQVPLIIEKLNEMYVKNQEPQCKPPIDGNDIMTYFSLKPSPRVGELLDKVKELCIEDPYTTKDKALEYLKAFV